MGGLRFARGVSRQAHRPDRLPRAHLGSRSLPLPHPAAASDILTSALAYESRCRAQEGSTVVSTVKDTRPATSTIPKPRLSPAQPRRPCSPETPPQQSRGSAQEGSTAVSAVKDTGAATSSISKPRLAARSHPAARRHLIDSQTRPFACTAETAMLVRMHIYEINQ